MAQNLIVMTEKEASRYDVIKKLIDGKINGTNASKLICLSIRQVKRIKAKVVKSGIKGIVHGNRGKESNGKICLELIEKTKDLLKTKYPDFGPTFASEKLEELHQIKLSKETVRRILIECDLWKPKSRKIKIQRSWRPRKDCFGEMEQFDGSYHHWFEDRAEEYCLLLAIDDAKGEITKAKFDLNESKEAVFKFWKEYVSHKGLPIAVYLDKFSTYKINHKNAVDNKDMITQFQRATNQLGVELITAHSPEAKGRVERVFETLQDRLVKEMRLRGISTIEKANEYLKEFIPKFNAKFAVIPNKDIDLHRPLTDKLKSGLPQIFSVQSQRIVCNDYTIMFKNRYFQLEREQPTTVFKKDTVIIEEHLNGEIKICLKGKYLNYSVLPERPKKINVLLPAITRQRTAWKPPINHPWRKQNRYLFGENSKKCAA